MFRYVFSLAVLAATLAFSSLNALSSANENGVFDSRQATSKSQKPDLTEANKKPDRESKEKKEINLRQPEESETTQQSRSLISTIFSSPWGIAGTVLLFVVLFTIIYYTLKTHQAANGG